MTARAGAGTAGVRGSSGEETVAARDGVESDGSGDKGDLRGTGMLIRLRLLDPGYVRLMIAIRTIIASVAALLISGAICRSAELPGGMTVIATVVAVLVARSLNAATLPHRLSALLYVPSIGLLAAFVARFMLHHAWLGAAAFVAAVGGSRYLTRFGGRTRRFGLLRPHPADLRTGRTGAAERRQGDRTGVGRGRRTDRRGLCDRRSGAPPGTPGP